MFSASSTSSTTHTIVQKRTNVSAACHHVHCVVRRSPSCQARVPIPKWTPTSKTPATAAQRTSTKVRSSATGALSAVVSIVNWWRCCAEAAATTTVYGTVTSWTTSVRQRSGSSATRLSRRPTLPRSRSRRCVAWRVARATSRKVCRPARATLVACTPRWPPTPGKT